ncbi:hypothetical protein J3Q64DRAFT_1693853 [Phycomyces blakesleeanus]|uniref:DH domain-containing protein n=2 Tax=Phycomyces blakesleeanus TaxID=4837 RepID=A0A167Q6V9_PHYB8|nr:hypothetical protein PHYBLDRAFT_179003 [Phycomyces blakesleeanus NRRL 1555(-)]OAD79176.1 hypothetical protein PHYBLDRAFT_179003 [Phycomyces blakesleeanus NRRL 1555(-)]|eukprot:XP_018297216.1 hypothetical protein PHYBLDRAFT_179003 [Phycomyces blakesleeanus NRRL 1555(-)]
MSYPDVKQSTFNDLNMANGLFGTLPQKTAPIIPDHCVDNTRLVPSSSHSNAQKIDWEHAYTKDMLEKAAKNECSLLNMSMTDGKCRLSGPRPSMTLWDERPYDGLDLPQKSSISSKEESKVFFRSKEPEFVPEVQNRNKGKMQPSSQNISHQPHRITFTNSQACETNRIHRMHDTVRPPPINTSAIVYGALISVVAQEFQQRIIQGDRVKNGIEYKNAFDGKEAVDKLALILNTTDRRLALGIGRALGAQRFFHDVNYESRLVDSTLEIYQFDDYVLHYANKTDGHISGNGSVITSPGTMTTASSIFSESLRDDESVTIFHDAQMDLETTEFPTGVFTGLTHCFVPTCDLNQTNNNRHYSVDTPLTISTTHKYLQTEAQQLWTDNVSPDIRASVSNSERKRQETIFELIYTEENFSSDLDYMNELWIEPLRDGNVIPASRRDTFIDKVFSNLLSIRNISRKLVNVLLERQNEYPIVSQIGDIMLKFAVDFEPFIYYGARQHEAKFVFEQERYINPALRIFAETTERNPSSKKLELNGYLTKPTTRLGRYTLLLNEILKHTPEGHPDRIQIPNAVDTIRQFLGRVNVETGKAKNKFDLERIHKHLTFKNKADAMDLKLLEEDRHIIKQGVLRKTSNLESTEYQAILLDNYLVISKIKIVHGRECHIVRKRPIPLELLEVSVPQSCALTHRSGSILSYIPTVESQRSSAVIGSLRLAGNTSITASRIGHPIVFKRMGRRMSETFTLYAPSVATRKPWLEHIQSQREIKNQRQPVFDIHPIIPERTFYVNSKINHIVTFKNGQFYVLATDNGVYLGRVVSQSPPRQVLNLERVTQVNVLESDKLLMVLADKVLWEYPLAVLSDTSKVQLPGLKLETQVPFFHVGYCLDKTLICVPQVSPLSTTITLYEPSSSPEKKSGSFLGIFGKTKKVSVKTRLRIFRKTYVPSEAWALELTPNNLLITCKRGIVIVDMHTNKIDCEFRSPVFNIFSFVSGTDYNPHALDLLDPNDKNLNFITSREKDESRLNIGIDVKHISLFCNHLKEYIVCYDEYAFYIDKKGRRKYPNFLIEWEGTPDTFAYSYPYLIAFEPSFIEIRNIITGNLEQIIRGKNFLCLSNGHKTEVPFIFGVMTDPVKDAYHSIFQLKLVSEDKTPPLL